MTVFPPKISAKDGFKGAESTSFARRSPKNTQDGLIIGSPQQIKPFKIAGHTIEITSAGNHSSKTHVRVKEELSLNSKDTPFNPDGTQHSNPP
jgi:hypothetical protein